MEDTYIGEVIESSTTEFIAESRALNGAPPFGAFVKVVSDPITIIGLVFNVFTHSIEPNRRPTAYGKTEEELRLEQPQIFELLKTEFQAIVLGYQDDGGVRQLLPPHPARIHSFVYPCLEPDIQAFTSSSDFLRTILNTSRVPADELLIATIRSAYGAHGHQEYLIQTGKELSRLIRDDYDRLSSIIRRISQ